MGNSISNDSEDQYNESIQAIIAKPDENNDKGIKDQNMTDLIPSFPLKVNILQKEKTIPRGSKKKVSFQPIKLSEMELYNIAEDYYFGRNNKNQNFIEAVKYYRLILFKPNTKKEVSNNQNEVIEYYRIVVNEKLAGNFLSQIKE